MPARREGAADVEGQGARGVAGRASTLLAAASTMALAVLARAPALHQPLDRDMAAHALIGASLTRGLTPYVDVIDNKQPLVYLLYAGLEWLRPHSTVLVRAAAMAVAAATVGVLVVLGRRRFGLPAVMLAGALTAVVGASRWVQGVDLNTEHLLTLTGAVAVLTPLWRDAGEGGAGWAALCGGLVGLAALSKAPGALFAAPALVALLWGVDRPGWPARLGGFLAGGVAVALPFVAWYAAIGRLGDLLYWNVTYNFAYSADAQAPWWRWIVPQSRVWPVVAFGAVAAVAVALWLRRRPGDRTGWTVAAWLAAAYVGAKLGQRDFPHYYAPLVAPASLALAWPAARPGAWPGTARRVVGATAAVAAVLAAPFVVDVAGQFGRSGDELAVRLYRSTQARPWIVQQEVGALLAELADPGDRLFVAGSEPGFYWTSELRPAVEHVVAFPRDVLPDFDAQIAAQLVADPPRFLVLPYDPLAGPPETALLESHDYRRIASRDPVGVYELVDDAG